MIGPKVGVSGMPVRYLQTHERCWLMNVLDRRTQGRTSRRDGVLWVAAAICSILAVPFVFGPLLAVGWSLSTVGCAGALATRRGSAFAGWLLMCEIGVALLAGPLLYLAVGLARSG